MGYFPLHAPFSRGNCLAKDHSRIWDISLYMPLSLEETAYRASLSIFLCISLSSKLIFCAYHKKALLSVINHVIILLDISNPALVTFWCSHHATNPFLMDHKYLPPRSKFSQVTDSLYCSLIQIIYLG